MFIFLRLLAAHLVGDFPLQFSSVYSAKVKGARGMLVHALIITAAMALFTCPFLSDPWMWGVLIFNGAGHFIQDWAKLSIARRIKNPNNFFVFIGDQILHILTAAVVWLTPLAGVSVMGPVEGGWMALYSDERWIILLISLMAVSFAGTFILATFKDTFLPKRFYTPYLEWPTRTYGILERTAMLILLLISPWLALALPAFLIPKIAYANREIKKLTPTSFAPHLCDTVLGIVLAVMTYGMYRAMLRCV